MNPKKIFLFIVLLSIILLPATIEAQGLVPCNGPDCTINSFFTLLGNIYHFIVIQIATPLAIIALIVGGIMLMLSAGNPNLAGLGKKILYSAIIGLALVFCSWLIIDFILKAIGYTGNWSII